MSDKEKPSKDENGESQAERRKGGDRRESANDRRGAGRVVTEATPRRKNTDRRKK